MSEEELKIFMDKGYTLKAIKNLSMICRLQRFGFDRTKTAKSLGISVRTVRNWISERRALGDNIPDSYFGTSQEVREDEAFTRRDQ